MSNQISEKKIQQDSAEIKKDINSLVGDGVSQVTKGFEKLTGDAKEALVGAADTVNKGIGHGLTQYNSKAQEFADKLPGGLGKKAAKYPWVAISVGLLIGLFLGGLLKPSRHS